MYMAYENSEPAQERSSFKHYVPAVAERMHALGLKSFKDIWDRVEPHVRANPEFFKGINYIMVHKAVSGAMVRNPEGNDYSKSLYAVAAGLDKSVEELFGPLLKEPVLPDAKADDYTALREMGDIYNSSKFGPASTVAEKQLVDAMQRALAHLKPQHAQCLTLRFGLAGDPCMGLREIADLWGTSHQYVAKVQDSAIRRLSNQVLSRKLQIHLAPL